MGDSIARTNFYFAIMTSKYNAVTRLIECNADVVVRDVNWVFSTLSAHALVVLVPMSTSLALVLSTTSRLTTVEMNILTRNTTGLLRELGRSKLLLKVYTQKSLIWKITKNGLTLKTLEKVWVNSHEVERIALRSTASHVTHTSHSSTLPTGTPMWSSLIIKIHI